MRQEKQGILIVSQWGLKKNENREDQHPTHGLGQSADKDGELKGLLPEALTGLVALYLGHPQAEREAGE